MARHGYEGVGIFAGLFHDSGGGFPSRHYRACGYSCSAHSGGNRVQVLLGVPCPMGIGFVGM